MTSILSYPLHLQFQYIAHGFLIAISCFASFPESDGLSLAKAAKLPLLVENEVKKISDGRSKLKLEERKHRKLLVDYQKVMS